MWRIEIQQNVLDIYGKRNKLWVDLLYVKQHFMLFLSLNVHIYLLTVIWYLLDSCLNGTCFLLAPINIFSFLLACLFTVAWYIILLVWHSLSWVHVLIRQQLPFFHVVLSVWFFVYCFIVVCYYLFHVWHAAVADHELYCVSVQSSVVCGVCMWLGSMCRLLRISFQCLLWRYCCMVGCTIYTDKA